MAGSSRVFRDATIGTGAPQTIAVPGFAPVKIRVTNRNGHVWEWQDSMPAGSAYKQIVAGDRTYTATNGITATATGFTIGSDGNSTVNAASTILDYEVWET